jgi:hypothetical protein
MDQNFTKNDKAKLIKDQLLGTTIELLRVEKATLLNLILIMAHRGKGGSSRNFWPK